MLYNAVDWKGNVDEVEEQDVDVIVSIHNHMNEKTWQKVLEWESLRVKNFVMLPLN